MIPSMPSRALPTTTTAILSSRELSALSRMAQEGDGIRKTDLHPGDRVLVTTRNSTYSIRRLENDRYEVSGGWFAQEGRGPMEVAINGCTFGGRAIHSGLLAAPGLYLEFGNRVVTTRIRRVDLIRKGELEN